MQICMVGWYFNPELLKLMAKVNERHEVNIVAHREGDGQGLPITVIPNIGLEFGCYDFFIRRIWDEQSNVLFMHDDLEILPLMVNYEIIPATNIFNKIAECKYDQAYIFQNGEDARWNAYRHGRMIYMSARALRYVKKNGGLWYDKGNTGQTTTGPYNAGIVNFDEEMKAMAVDNKFDTCKLLFAPCITMLRRNGKVPNTLNAVVGGQNQ